MSFAHLLKTNSQRQLACEPLSILTWFNYDLYKRLQENGLWARILKSNSCYSVALDKRFEFVVSQLLIYTYSNPEYYNFLASQHVLPDRDVIMTGGGSIRLAYSNRQVVMSYDTQLHKHIDFMLSKWRLITYNINYLQMSFFKYYQELVETANNDYSIIEMCLYKLTRVYTLHTLPINTHMVHVCDVRRILNSKGPSVYSKFFKVLFSFCSFSFCSILFATFFYHQKITYMTQVPSTSFLPTCCNHSVYLIDFGKIFSALTIPERVEFEKITSSVAAEIVTELDETGTSLHTNQIHQQLNTLSSFCHQIESPSVVLQHPKLQHQDSSYFLQLRKNELVLANFVFKNVDFTNPYLFRLEYNVLWFQHCGSIYKLNLRTMRLKHVLKIRQRRLENDDGEQFVFCQFYKKNIVVYDRLARSYFTISILKSAHVKENITVATTDHFKYFRAWNTHLDGYLQTRPSWPAQQQHGHGQEDKRNNVACLKPCARFFKLTHGINVYMGSGGPTHIGRIENHVFVLNRDYLLVFTN